MAIKNQPNKVKKTLEKAHKIAIFGHHYVDGDCVGSMLGLGSILEKMGKIVHYYTTVPVHSGLQFVPNRKKIKTNFNYGNFDCLVFVDFSWYNRIGSITQWHEEYFDKQNIVVIDHHYGDWPKHALHLKDVDVTSNCEWIFEHAHKRRPKYIDEKIATYFYLGLTTDSGNFLYDKDHKRIFKNAKQLIKYGAKKDFIIHNIFYSNSANGVQFISTVIQRIKIKHNILYTYFSEKEIEEQNINIEEADNGFMLARSIKWPKLCIRFRIGKDHIAGSLRSSDHVSWFITTTKEWVDCAKLAQDVFGWWWHKKASWFRIPLEKDIEKHLEKIVDKIDRYLKKL